MQQRLTLPFILRGNLFASNNSPLSPNLRESGELFFGNRFPLRMKGKVFTLKVFPSNTTPLYLNLRESGELFLENEFLLKINGKIYHER